MFSYNYDNLYIQNAYRYIQASQGASRKYSQIEGATLDIFSAQGEGVENTKMTQMTFSLQIFIQRKGRIHPPPSSIYKTVTGTIITS